MVHPRKLLFYSRLNALDMIFQDVNDQLLSLFVLLTLGLSRCSNSRVNGEASLALGHLMASAVAGFMGAKESDSSRIKKVSYRKGRLLIKGSNEEAWAKNRRVEINHE